MKVSVNSRDVTENKGEKQLTADESEATFHGLDTLN